MTAGQQGVFKSVAAKAAQRGVQVIVVPVR